MEDKDDIKYWRNTLENYYLLKKNEKFLNQEILRLDLKIEQERIAVHGMCYEGSTAVVGDGCSAHYAKQQPVSYLVNKQTELNAVREITIFKYKNLDTVERIMERFSNISVESQIIINNVFQREMTFDEIAKLEDVSKTTIKNRFDKALKEMIEAC
ncbi:MAG: hypothetical protein ACLUVC_02230 [Longibaculum sp.]